MNLLKQCLCALATGAALAMPGVAGAADLVANGSFEDVPFSLGGGSFCYAGLDCASAVPSWTGSFVLMQSTSSFWNATPNTPADQYQVGLQGVSTLEQQVNFTAPGLYQLSWFDAGRSNISGNQVYAVYLDDTSFFSSYTMTAQDWQAKSGLFEVQTAGVQTLSFRGLTAGNHTTFIDNISLITAVPEPSTWALVIAGLAATAAAARRRRA